MTKLTEQSQFGLDTDIFKCWCGEYSYLEVIKDSDGDIYVAITQYPRSITERLKAIFGIITGTGYSGSNSVMVTKDDVNKLIKALKK